MMVLSGEWVVWKLVVVELVQEWRGTVILVTTQGPEPTTEKPFNNRMRCGQYFWQATKMRILGRRAPIKAINNHYNQSYVHPGHGLTTNSIDGSIHGSHVVLPWQFGVTKRTLVHRVLRRVRARRV